MRWRKLEKKEEISRKKQKEIPERATINEIEGWKRERRRGE